MMAKVRVCLAAPIAFGSPPDVIILIPESMIKMSAMTPANMSAARTRFSKTIGTQSSDAIFSVPLRHESHSLNIKIS